MSSQIIKGKTITYEEAFNILTSKTSPQGKGKRSLTFQEVAKKFNVSVGIVESIKNGTFLNQAGVRMRIGTLFSGIGSPEQGASRVYDDLDLVFACEWDKYARESFKANYDIQDEHFHKDIADMDGTQYKDKVDIIIGGSPCQDFSIAGLRKGIEGNKGVLIYEYIRIIDEVSPPIFIYENVKGMLSQTMLELPIYDLKEITWQSEYQKSISNTLKTMLAKYLLGIYKENSDLKSIKLDISQTKYSDLILEKLESLALIGVTKKLQSLVTTVSQIMKKQSEYQTEQIVQLECKEEDLVLNQKLLSLIESMSHKDINLSDITEIMKESIDLLQSSHWEDLLKRMKSYTTLTEESSTTEKKIYVYAQELNTCLYIINLWKSSQNLLREVLSTSINQIKSIKSKKIIDEFVEAFREMGYYCHYEVLNTKDYGVPQNRERIFLVGFKCHEHYYNFSFASKYPLTIRLKDLLEDEVDEKYYLKNKTIASFEMCKRS